MEIKRAPYKHDFGQIITTDVGDVALDRGFIAHFQVAADAATVSDTDGIHASVTCDVCAVSATAVVKAASAVTDILTITAPAEIGAAANELSILLLTADDDNLLVEGNNETGVISIALANTSAANNTATLIQAAIRGLEDVSGIDVTGFTCTAGGNWNTAAIATGEEEAVAFEGGVTEGVNVLTEDIEQPSVPRNITATAGGVAGDIKAIQVIIEGTNYANEEISEELPVFTVNTAGTVSGNKAFKTVTKITIPAHDGAGATTQIGYGEKLGLPYNLAHNTVVAVCRDNARETTAPAVTVDAEKIENNTIDLHSALNGTVVDVYLIV